MFWRLNEFPVFRRGKTTSICKESDFYYREPPDEEWLFCSNKAAQGGTDWLNGEALRVQYVSHIMELLQQDLRSGGFLHQGT